MAGAHPAGAPLEIGTARPPCPARSARSAGAVQAIATLEVIYSEDVHNVAYGSKWFHFLCGRDDAGPSSMFHALIKKYFKGGLKAPFTEEKCAEAVRPPDFSWSLATGRGPGAA